MNQSDVDRGMRLEAVMRGTIALHRLRKTGYVGTKRFEELSRDVGRVFKLMDDEDKARIKQFSKAMETADVSSNDKVIIEDFLRKVMR